MGEITGILEGIQKGKVIISGVEYPYPDYVEPYVSRRKLNEAVDALTAHGKTEKDRDVVYIIKIMPHREGSGSSGKGGKKKDEIPLKHFVGVFRKSDGVNALITIEKMNKLFCLPSEMKDRFIAAKTPRVISIDVDSNSFIVKAEFGGEIDDSDLPPIVETGVKEKAPKKTEEKKTEEKKTEEKKTEEKKTATPPPSEEQKEKAAQQAAAEETAKEVRARVKSERAKEKEPAPPAGEKQKASYFGALTQIQKDQLIVLQSTFKAVTEVYIATETAPSRTFDQAIHEIMIKTIEVTKTMMKEVTEQ